MWLKFQKFSAIVVGTAGGVIAYLQTNSSDRYCQNSTVKYYQSPASECGKWDPNWDFREAQFIVKPPKDDTVEEQNRFNKQLEKYKPKVSRHIVLIRHGEYRETGSDAQNKLTDVGKHQAKHTGQRLKSLNIQWDKVIVSTQTRAQETACIINQVIGTYPVENCPLIREGAPIPPEPSVGHWKPELVQFYRDNARIEAAFRKYFHRAEPDQKKDSFTLLVCHANVIRYFVCRALQFPPEAWLRMSLNHASITWISILPSGRVTLRTLGDSGHIPPDLLTHKAK